MQCIEFGLGLLRWQGEEPGMVDLRLQGIEFRFQLLQSGWQIIQLQLQLVREFACFFAGSAANATGSATLAAAALAACC